MEILSDQIAKLRSNEDDQRLIHKHQSLRCKVLDKSPHSEKRPAAFVNSASRCQPGSSRDCTVVRQRHCPSPRPGIFIRAVDPKPRTSCNGTTASAALEARARRIISHTALRASPGADYKHTARLRTHLEPTACRVVIVRTGIDDAIVDAMVRQMRIIWIAVKGKLQHAHARQLKLSRSSALGSNEPQVFGQ